MLLRNKEDGRIYDVTSEYSDDRLAVYAALEDDKAETDPDLDNFAWDYTTLKEFNEDWEDVD